jgi:eukaryotic-like serine/threonine-protein kinase
VADVEPPPPPDPRIGAVLQGRYRILSRLASGAMGVVYRGERVQLGRPVAVKFLHPWIAAQKAFLTRFETEARAMSRLLHPNCVSVIDFGVEGSPFLVMDFVTGRTVRELMQGGRLPIARALRIVQQLLAGLSHAHAQGIVHRDLKPENLILSDEEGLEDHLRILDFGLAKLRDGPAMTAGLAIGTPSYMSPEQSGADGAIDARTDLYTVGVVLFELLAGRKPFESENVGELILMHRETAAPLLRQAAPDAHLTAEMEALVGKAMSKLADERFQSAAEMSAALDRTPEANRVREAGGPRHPAGATTVDTISAVRRRLGPEAGAPAGTSIARWRLIAFGGAFLVIALLALLLGRGLRGSDDDRGVATTTGGPGAVHSPPPATAPGKAPPSGSASAPARSGPPSARLEEARRLVARGDKDAALTVLADLRTTEPENADVPYLQALVFLDMHRVSDGVAAAQLAVRKDPALRGDADLVKALLHALANDRGYERAQALLRSLGQPAMPFIREAARQDPNPKVRERANELLAGGGRGWSSSRSSGSSMFKR